MKNYIRDVIDRYIKHDLSGGSRPGFSCMAYR